jgi:hypothetical protein
MTPLMEGEFRAHHNGMRKLMSIVAMTATLLMGSAHAIEVADLYQGQAIVTGIFEPERTRGLRQVLLDVLVKVSAEPRLIDDPRVQPLLDRAKELVSSYEYEDRMKGTPVRDEQGTRDRPHDLRIKFDQAKIDAALAELGLQPWGSDRPALVALITVEYPANKYVLTAKSDQGLGQRQALTAAATRRGLAVVLPEDANAASGATLNGTLRWQPDTVSWRTDWTLIYGLKNRSWSIETSSFDEAFRNGVGEAAATLAGRR